MAEMIKICPYLGMADDPATNTSFPSSWNFCYKAKPAEVVEFSHQHDFCLSENYINCPVFLRSEKKALPAKLRVPRDHLGRGHVFNWKIIPLIVVLFGLLTFAGFRSFGGFQISISPGANATSIMESAFIPDTGMSVKELTQTPTLDQINTDPASDSNSAFTQTVAILMEFTDTPIPSPTPTLTRRPISIATPPPAAKSKPKPTKIPAPTAIPIPTDVPPSPGP
jgi:hypothetical protein